MTPPRLTLEDLDAMSDDTGDPFWNPEATDVVSTAETTRLLEWTADENDIDMDGKLDTHDELLEHLKELRDGEG